MASVPNLPIAPAVVTPGVPGSPDGDGFPADFFAQLLGGGPALAVIAGPGAMPPAGEMTLRAAPKGDGEADEPSPDGTSPPDIIPSLQAQSGFAVAVGPANPARPTAETVPAALPPTDPLASGAIPAPTPPSAKSAAPPPMPPIVPVKEAAPAVEIAAVAVKAAIDKLGGKALAAKPGRAAAPTPDTPPPEMAIPASAPRQPETPGARIEGAAQPVLPAAVPAAPAPMTPAFAAAPTLPNAVAASAAPAPDAVSSVADLVIERQLDLSSDDLWLDRLARDIARAGASDEPLRFRLHPQTLGHLQVELTQGERGATVRLTVETEAARTILADAQPRLAAEARAQGVRLAGTEVDLGTAHQQGGDARRNAEAQPHNVVRVVRGAEPDAHPSATAQSRSDRYA